MSDPSPPPSTREQTPEDQARILGPVPVFAAGDPVPGLNSWALDRKLGGGGFGQVWLARDSLNPEQPPRAVKFCTDPQARHRLMIHERNVVLRVMKYAGKHPNIVPLLDFSRDGVIPWLMYEYVEGGTLADLIDQWESLPVPQRLGRAIKVLHGIASGLAACHGLDPPLVHRDLKPQNVLMAGAVPRITDFGIGSVVLSTEKGEATVEGTVLWAHIPAALRGAGTRAYCPPEQLFGRAPNPREDVFALGVIAYQLVVGDRFAGPGTGTEAELRDRKVPRELAALIVRSVALNADRRPKDAGEWLTALDALSGRYRQPQGPGDTGSPSRPVLVTEPALQPTDLLQTRAAGKPSPLPRRPEAPIAEERPEPKPRRKWFAAGCVGLLLAALAPALWFALRAASRPAPHGGLGPGVVQRPRDKEPEPRTLAAKFPECDIEIAPGVKMRFRWVPAGECQLGSPEAERNKLWLNRNRSDETEEVRGRFRTPGFWLGKYEVTQAEWAAVMRGTKDETPSHFVPSQADVKKAGVTDTSRFPVENVSWDMICKPDGFLDRANAFADGMRTDARRGRFCLPHEDEWEYAYRGGLGNGRPFYWGESLNGTEANCNGEYPSFGGASKGPYLGRTCAVDWDNGGKYEKHPWGLMHMSGNVSEWCENLHDDVRSRQLRGGCWYSFPEGCRAASRGGWMAASRVYGYGFRVCFRLD